MATAAPKRHRSFTTKRERTPIEFDINGNLFFARPVLPGGVVIDLVSSLAGINAEDEDQKDAAATLEIVIGFFKTTLQPDSFEQFEKVIRDPEEEVEFSDISDVMSWLMEQYTGRNLAD